MRITTITILTLILLSTGCLYAQTSNNSNQQDVVLISTAFGDMKVMLYDETPQHKENFLKLVEEGFYDSLLFHRVISEFMIQGGDPDSRVSSKGQPLGQGGPGYTIPAEFNPEFYHKKGALAAARTGDHVNPKKASSGSQFYLVMGRIFDEATLSSMEQQTGNTFSEEQKQVYQTLGGTPHLDYNYTVFGEVIEGLEVIDRIAAQPTDGRNRPLENVVMSIRLLKE